MSDEKVEPIVEKPKKNAAIPKLTPEQLASRKRAHDIKVAKMLAGGEF